MPSGRLSTFAFVIGTAGVFAACFLGTAILADSLEDVFRVDPDHPAILYSDRLANDPVARLESKLENGETTLDYAPNGWGYLPSILKQLGISVDSQVLVFSKGSIQAQHISPETPRAIYFDDEVSVGYVQRGDELEVTGLDPQQGIYLYTMEAAKSDQPRFTRRLDCLRCHQGPVTLGVPGLMITSLVPSSMEPGQEHGGSYATDDRVRMGLRWGGWYVTGTTGSQTHLGNNVHLVDPAHPGGPAQEVTQNIISLADFLDTSKYLMPTSDLVALMTLEHQVRMTNLLTRIGWDTRIVLHDSTNDGKIGEAASQKINGEIEQLVSYMLFAGESSLAGPVAGASSFAKSFSQLGPRDDQGRSLRDFDLQTRLFKYPLSYMIYSDAFDGLPDAARSRIYRRLYDVLSGKDKSDSYKRLSAGDRQAVLEIVRQTKKNLPNYWITAIGQ